MENEFIKKQKEDLFIKSLSRVYTKKAYLLLDCINRHTNSTYTTLRKELSMSAPLMAYYCVGNLANKYSGLLADELIDIHNIDKVRELKLEKSIKGSGRVYFITTFGKHILGYLEKIYTMQ